MTAVAAIDQALIAAGVTLIDAAHRTRREAGPVFGWRAARRGLVGMIVSWQEGKRRMGCEPIDQPVRLATSREQVRAIDEWRRKEPDGFVTVTGVGSRGGMADRVSCRCDSVGPLRSCLGSEDPQGRSGDQVALKVESVVDRGVHVQETLGGFGRFKALQLALCRRTT